VIGIVGAGISGLALGLELRKRGVPYRILEAADVAGGLVRTVQVEGVRLELGPQRIRATPEILDLLGPQVAPEDEGPLLVARGARLHPVPRTWPEALRCGGLSRTGRLRAALWPLMALRAPDPLSVTAGAYLRHLAGEEAYRTFLGPLFGGLYGSDPDRMEAHRALLPALRSLGGAALPPLLGAAAPRWLRGRRNARAHPWRAPVLVPRGGMAALTQALLAPQRARVLFRAPVMEIATGRAGSPVLVTGSERIRCRHVIVTAPPPAASRILGSSAPDASARLGRLHLNHLALVHLDVDRLPPGLGFQVAFGEPVRIRGATFSGNLDGSGRTAVAYLGGMQDPAAHLAADTELAATAAGEFGALTGTRARPLHLHRAVMPAWDASWRALDGLELPAGVHLLTNYTGRPGILGRLQDAARLAALLAGEGSFTDPRRDGRPGRRGGAQVRR
jgi:protoporphyrinogen/coproporphyrinogen III oxidase